jgi:hypothetical protein
LQGPCQPSHGQLPRSSTAGGLTPLAGRKRGPLDGSGALETERSGPSRHSRQHTGAARAPYTPAARGRMAVQSPTFGGPPRGPEDASLVDFIKASSAAAGLPGSSCGRRRQLHRRCSSPCRRHAGCVACSWRHCLGVWHNVNMRPGQASHCQCRCFQPTALTVAPPADFKQGGAAALQRQDCVERAQQ